MTAPYLAPIEILVVGGFPYAIGLAIVHVVAALQHIAGRQLPRLLAAAPRAAVVWVRGALRRRRVRRGDSTG